MKKIFLLCVAFVGIISSLNAQSNVASQSLNLIIDEVAKISLTTNGVTVLEFGSPDMAGESITNPRSNKLTYLNYSSMVPASGANATRIISVTSDEPVAGYNFTVEADEVTGLTSAGKLGTATGAVSISNVLSNTSRLVTGIKSCYTGTEAISGRRLTYSASVVNTNYGNLTSGTKTFRVTYTLSNNP